LHEQVSAPGYAESRATELAAITQKKNEIIQVHSTNLFAFFVFVFVFVYFTLDHLIRRRE
jgi:hypothetical protein